MTPTSSTPLNSVGSARKKRLRFNSFGVKLFGVIVGGAVLSIAGVTFLFSETVKLQAEEQIQKIIESKVGTIREVTDRAETLADSLGISVATLHVRRAETPETYQELTRKLFEEHPDYIVGLGFGQKEYGILPSEQWFYPYYQAQQLSSEVTDQILEATPKATPEPTPETSQNLTRGGTQAASVSSARYIDRALSPYFYPETEAYRTYFLPQKDSWTSPYQSSEAKTSEDNSLLLTYYSQIFDNENEWIGTAVVDVDGAYLSEIISESIYREQGSLVLVSENGDIIANPANPENVESQTYVDFPGLTEIWSKINAEATTQAVGLIEGESGYWSYSRVPEQSWLVVAYVPYWAVFERIVLIALAAMLPAGLLMAGLTALVVRALNRRLRPVIDECQRLSPVDGAAGAALQGRDELEQLSIAFFNLLEQLKLCQIQPHKPTQQTAEQLIELLPPEGALLTVTQHPSDQHLSDQQLSNQKLSAQRLQKELLYLNEAVSSLADDSRLSDINAASPNRGTSSQQPSSSNLSEITSIQNQLNQILPQVLAALSQFSHLLTAFDQTQSRALLIQDIMLSAKRDIETQTNIVNQLQQHAARFQPLVEMSSQTVNETQKQDGTQSQEVGELAAPLAFNTLQATAQTLREQLKALSSAAEKAHRKTKDYQNIASTAQVLIMNASTLAISASRSQSSKTHEEIVGQLRSKETALKALAKQLETAPIEQQFSDTSIEMLTTELDTVISTLDRAMQQLDSAVQPALGETSHHYEASQPVSSRSAQAIATHQQLVEQIKALRQSLRQMKILTDDMGEHVASTLQQTRKIGSIRADVSFAIGPSEG